MQLWLLAPGSQTLVVRLQGEEGKVLRGVNPASRVLEYVRSHVAVKLMIAETSLSSLL